MTIGVVSANSNVSEAFSVPRPGRFVVLQDSIAGTSVGLQFAAATDAASAEYRTLARSDGTGVPYTATSGSLPAVSAPVVAPLPAGRLLLGATVNAVRSFQVVAAWT